MTMNGSTIAGSPLLYTMIAIGLGSIVVYALIAIKKAKACAIDQGISPEVVRNVIISTISASIVPSLAILIGFLLLANSLGSAWPWWRLSVIGALQYETMAATYATSSMNIELGSLLTGPAENYTGVMLVMTLGIVAGPVVTAFTAEKYSTGLMKAKSGSDWGNIAISSIPMAIIAVYVPLLLFSSIPSAAAFMISVVVTLLCAVLSMRIKWLQSFTIGISILAGVAAGVLVEYLMK